VLCEALDGEFRFVTPEGELRVQLALLNALTVRPVALERLPATIARVFELMTLIDNIGLKASAARTIVIVSAHTAQLDTGVRAQNLLVPLLDHPGLLPYNRAMCFFALSWFNVQAYELERAENYIARTEAMARDEGMPQLARLAHYMAGYAEALRGRFEFASRRALLMEQNMFADHPFDLASNRLLKALIGVFSSDAHSAIKHASNAVELFDLLGSRFHQVAARNTVVMGYVQLGNEARANELMQEVEAIAAKTGFAESTVLNNGITRAYLAWKRSDTPAAAKLLQAALALAKAKDWDCWLMWRLGPLAELCGFALDMEIEVDYVRCLIHKYSWQPPSRAAENWPWRIKVHTFGRFEVLKDDKPLEFSRKAPKRVLSLLKAIVAFGGKEVPETRLADVLWPGQEGDVAHKAFEVTLRRLRTLLGADGLVEVSGSLVGLNERLCWVDAWAFERALRYGSDPASTQEILELYQGNFLPNDSAEPWTVSPREKMRARFVRCLSDRGQQLESIQDFQRAITLYQRGIETDELAESFYQGLMRCYAATDRRAEAMSVFRRLRQALSITLGLPPSTASQELARRIGG
jgi:DNA-binding SARP family transcriptional activator